MRGIAVLASVGVGRHEVVCVVLGAGGSLRGWTAVFAPPPSPGEVC